MLRASMAKGIAKLPDVEVVDAGTFAEALRFIDERPPELILSDLDLPDRAGLELLGALATRGLRIPIIFISAYLKAYGGQIPPHANVEVREKPVALDELRKLVKQHLGVTERSPFSVTDYLQIAAMGSHSVEITLKLDDDTEGRIVVVSGQLWGAEDGRDVGVEAFKRLAMMQDVAIACTALRSDPGERNIFGSLEHLLLEAAQQQDEGQRFEFDFIDDSASLDTSFPDPSPQLADAKPEPEFIAEPEPEPAPVEDFNSLWTRANEAILDRNYEEALVYLRKAEAVDPDNPKVQKWIQKLEKKS
jgi:CheY-like chemotaxis protein